MKVHHFLFSAICILLMAISCQKEPQVIKVESVALNTTSLTIVEGESQSLTATVSPSNADNKKVTWSSSNSSVATVDDRGTVTAIAPGTATVTAKTEDGGKTATCSVTVNSRVISVESVSLDKTTAEITEGETLTLTATVKPDNATNKKVTWSSSNEEIATVKDGAVTALKEGEAIITAKTEDGGKTATCNVKVNAKTIAVESVSLDKTEASLKVGETITLTATISPDDATDKTITWSSSDEFIATVEEGVVTAIGVGDAIITAKSGDKTATCAVTVKAEETKNPFTITSVGSTSVSINKVGAPYDITLDYRKGSGSWSVYTIGNSIDLGDEEFVQFRAGEGGNAKFSKDYYGNFYNVVVSGSGKVKASGNIMSLLDRTEKRITMPEYGFYSLFTGCDKLADASKLVLPATTLAPQCYEYMFYGCSNLQTAPELPATVLAKECYQGMFDRCLSLHTAPELPATTLAEGCYSSMFNYCSSLQTTPDLPATTLADACYSSMFNACTGLQTAPELPATTLAGSCYYYMFNGCTSLLAAPDLPATTLARACYSYMFYGCTNLQTVPKELPATTLAEDCYSLMFCDCYSLQTAPELPATTLIDWCYSKMFNGCNKLNYVKALFETTPSDSYTRDWLSGVSSTGTFVKSKNATWDVTGPNGIPSGWTVQIAE